MPSFPPVSHSLIPAHLLPSPPAQSPLLSYFPFSSFLPFSLLTYASSYHPINFFFTYYLTYHFSLSSSTSFSPHSTYFYPTSHPTSIVPPSYYSFFLLHGQASHTHKNHQLLPTINSLSSVELMNHTTPPKALSQPSFTFHSHSPTSTNSPTSPIPTIQLLQSPCRGGAVGWGGCGRDWGWGGGGSGQSTGPRRP